MMQMSRSVVKKIFQGGGVCVKLCDVRMCGYGGLKTN